MYKSSASGVERRNTTGARTTSSARSKEEADFQRAIAASLADSGSGSASSTTGPAFALRTNPTTRTPQLANEEDPDLAAAIAASLRDIASAPSAPRADEAYRPYSAAYQPYPTAQASSYTPLASYDLSAQETTSLSRFTSLLSSPPPQLGSQEREIYEAAKRAHPRLERGLEDTERRKELLQEMEGKLGEVVRLYEGLLREKEQAQYAPPPQQQYYQPPPQPSRYPSSSYPQLSSPQSQSHSAAPAVPYYPSAYPQQQSYQPEQPAYNYPSPSPGAYVQSPQHQQTYPQYPDTTQSASQQQQQPQTQAYLQYPNAPPPQQQQAQEAQAQYQQYSTPLDPAAADYYPAQSYYPTAPVTAPAPPQEASPAVQLPQQQQPAGYYKPSSFPAAPTTALPTAFPSVPVDNPWERETIKEEAEAKTGELIEL